MSNKAVIELGDQATSVRLFTYPNDGHTDQTLQQTVEHYLNDSIQREGLSALLAADIAADRCAVTITLDDEATAQEIAARYQAFFENGKAGLQAADAFRAGGKWDPNWKFLLPLGVPMAFAKAIEIMDFPPLTLIKNQDYLKSKTTSRWWELLMLNGVTDGEKARYSCILDIVPVAAPASDGEKLRLSGIYDGPFDSYGMPLLELLVRTQTSQYRPLIALGLPIRVWITRLWNLTLKVMDTGTIALQNGATCNVIATNHPSFFYYAVNSNTGPGAADKNLAAGLAVMKQDIVCAAWHAEMGKNPGADPKAVFNMSTDKWKDRDADLLDLVKKQAGIPKILEAKEVSAEVSLAAVKPLMPTAEELEELERKFYASGAQHPLEETGESQAGGDAAAPEQARRSLMADYRPFTLRIVDEHGQELFSQTVPFEAEIDVRGIMERAFVISQTAAAPDPFLYDLQYYGYSEAAQFPGYLGYEVESIFGKPNDAQFYWSLSIDGVLSPEGADSMQPGPGSTVLWTFTPVPANPQQLAPRTREIHARRATRTEARRS